MPEDPKVTRPLACLAPHGRAPTLVLGLARELGPRSVTVDEIAAAAVVGKQTNYRRSPSKSAVIVDALVELTDAVSDRLPESTYEAVRVQMRRVARMLSSRNGELIRELVANTPPQGAPALTEAFREWFFAHRRTRGAATLRRAIATGELRSDLDVDDALDLLYEPRWLRLLAGHRRPGLSAVDRLPPWRGRGPSTRTGCRPPAEQREGALLAPSAPRPVLGAAASAGAGSARPSGGGSSWSSAATTGLPPRRRAS